MQVPLADSIRPTRLEDLAGQEHLLGEKSLIRQSIKNQHPISFILWGPPGSGKTTLARLYAKAFSCRFVSLSALFSGVSELKRIFKEAEESSLFVKHTLLFVDEIHRFNKSQQDAFLPYLENGTITLIGATTENPSFALNNSLLSRLHVLKLTSLNQEALYKILQRYEREFTPLPLNDEGKRLLIEWAAGDGRYLLNLIENVASVRESDIIPLEELGAVLQKRAALFDKAGDGHHMLISALHKSVRGSDANAALYWLARMLEGGEDPLYLARRLIRMAVEDIGLADPEAIKLTIAAQTAYETLGSPEGELALAEATLYLALAPKSNALYTAYKQAREIASQTTAFEPPAIIVNAPTRLMKELGYGKDYIYDPDTPESFSGQNYFPDQMTPQKFYFPVERGFEREMKKRLSYFDQLRTEKKN